MTTKVNFSNIKPCDQEWDTMKRCEGGRICAKCNEIIFDFRGKSDWEIALVHARRDKKVCGIYDTKTIRPKGRALQSSEQLRRSIVTGLFGLFTTTAVIHGQSPGIDIDSSEISINEAYENDEIGESITRRTDDGKSNQTQREYILKGILKDEFDQPFIGATVIIIGSERGGITNVDGRFRIDLTEELNQNEHVELSMSYVGYGQERITLNRNQFDEKEALQLSVSLEHKVEMDSFVVRRTPWYRRIWNGMVNRFK